MHWYRTPEEMRTIGALGGSASGQSKRDLKPWQRAMLTTRATLARAYPDNPILRMDQVHIAQLLEASWKAGYRAGAGRAPK